MFGKDFERELPSSDTSKHPVKVARRNYPNPGELTSLQEMKDKATNKDVKVIATITNIESMITQEGDPLAFLRLEDDTSIISAVAFWEAYKESKDLGLLKTDVVLLITGKTDNKWKDRPQLLIVDKIESLGRLN
jgi:DNA polymerase III alpha subunit